MAKHDLETAVPLPLMCLPGQGCSPVIEMRREFSSFMAAAIQNMADHDEKSKEVWVNHKARLDTILDDMTIATESFINGKSRMTAIEKEAKDHVKGKYSIHSLINVAIGSLGTCTFVLIIFVGLVHPEFLRAVANYIGIV